MVTPIEEVMNLPFIESAILGTKTPSGRRVRLLPPATTTPYLEESGSTLAFAPSYGEHTEAVLAEVGFTHGEIEDLKSRGVVR